MGDQEAVPDVLMIPDHNATHRNEYAAVYARVCTAANTPCRSNQNELDQPTNPLREIDNI